MPESPTARLINLPEELMTGKRFVCWQMQERDDKQTKVPMSPHGGLAKVNDASTWGDFLEAVNHCEEKHLSGIGIILSKNEGLSLVGIDLDHCIDDSGNLSPEAKEIVKDLNSYSEITPSGKGLRIFVKGQLPDGARRKGPVEIYDDLRYLTLTGNHLQHTPETVEGRQDELVSVWRKFVAGEKQEQHEKTIVTSNTIPDDELIQRAMSAKNGEAFKRLYQGDFSDHPSQSEADLSLCCYLAFWTGNDAGRMDGLFRQSGLYREKWDRVHIQGRTYGEETTRKAIEGTVETYRPFNGERVQQMEGSYNGNRLLRTLGQASGTSLEGAPYRFAMTDLGNSERLVYLYGDFIRYCHARKKWFLWKGTHWKMDAVNEIEILGKDVVRAIPAEGRGKEGDDFKNVMKHAGRSENTMKVKSMISLAESEVPISPDDFDRDPWLLNVRNGTLDLRTGELRAARKEDMITRILDVDYDPQAQCPTWTAFLHTVMDGREDLIKFLQQATGYSLTGDVREQVLFFLYGKGANGKSTFIEAVMNLLGAYSKHTRPETFMMKKEAGSSNDIADLDGVRMVAAVELEEGRRLAEVLTKQVSGGDTLKARYLFQEYFEFKPQFKLWLCGNHKPKIRGTDHAIWRRIRLIPWCVTIPDDRQDRDLPSKLKAEWPGILAWAVRGCREWQMEGLSKPDAVIAATADYRKEMDVLGDFFDTCVSIEDGASTTKKELYETYTQYCNNNGEDSRDRLGKKHFNARVGDMGFDTYITGKNVHTWVGLKVTV